MINVLPLEFWIIFYLYFAGVFVTVGHVGSRPRKIKQFFMLMFWFLLMPWFLSDLFRGKIPNCKRTSRPRNE